MVNENKIPDAIYLKYDGKNPPPIRFPFKDELMDRLEEEEEDRRQLILIQHGPPFYFPLPMVDFV